MNNASKSFKDVLHIQGGPESKPLLSYH